MTPTIGIDLGTTNSLVAVMEKDGPRLIPNAIGQVLTPSVVGWEAADQILVGAAAREYQILHPERCASIFKRHMGSDWTTQILGRSRSAIDLSSCVLKSLKADAEAYLRTPVTKAVITVPAYFNEEQRRATIAAGRMAGLEVERILNEPTAAAIAYGMHSPDAEKVAVVVDLGGGTFDISVVEMFDGTLEIRASAGEIFLGGEDFTDSIASQLLVKNGMRFERVEMEEPLRMARLRRECELAKRKLSKEPQAEIRLPNKKGEFDESSTPQVITQEQFAQSTRSILDRILSPMRRALGDAGLKREQVDDVILVGGATRMPSLIERVTELFGKTPLCSLNPDEVVALGAAVHAGLIDRHEALSEMVVTDVAPFTMGVEICREIGGEDRQGYFLPIINRNTTIPVSRVERVSTRTANQTSVRVAVFQGESRMVKDNQLLGEFSVEGIPRGPAGQEIDLRFTYDLNGVLEVEATIVETRRKAVQVFTRHAKNMSDRQIASAVQEMQALKLHPRDDAVNRFLLRRAERVYAELPLRERQLLDQLITGFEQVLELRDQESTERFREGLKRFLSDHDPEGDDHDVGENSQPDW